MALAGCRSENAYVGALVSADEWRRRYRRELWLLFRGVRIPAVIDAVATATIPLPGNCTVAR
jgi:hypothetical protein